jgi:hypothetical protein
MLNITQIPRRGLVTLSLALFVAASLVGCTGDPKPPTFDASKFPPADELRDRIDAMVAHTRDERILNTKTHNAWQIVHGILPYGKSFKVEHEGQEIGALDYLLQGGELRGWELRPGAKGVVAVVAEGSKAAQGHRDQWIGYISQLGLKLDEKLVVNGKDYALGDLITQAEWDIFQQMEASWTLMAEAAYNPPNHKWKSSDGEEWTIERVLEMECNAPIVGDRAACGGTHRMYAITLALNKYLDYQKQTEGKVGELKGGWKKADDLVQDCIRKVKSFQQKDGSFSTNFFARPGSSPDVDNTLHSTGHTLEWLVIALDNKQFEEPWVTAAVVRLVGLLESNQERELDCGGLYHAARGLMLYRQRKFPADGSAPAKQVAPAPAPDDGNTPPAPPDAKGEKGKDKADAAPKKSATSKRGGGFGSGNYIETF